MAAFASLAGFVPLPCATFKLGSARQTVCVRKLQNAALKPRKAKSASMMLPSKLEGSHVTPVDPRTIRSAQTSSGDETNITNDEWKGETQAMLVIAVLWQILGFAVPVLAAMHDSSLSDQSVMELLSTKYLSHIEMMLGLNAFALVHSGLASLRPFITPKIGERIYRIIFALSSLPLAVGVIAFYIAHRYDGLQLWTVQGVPGVHDLVYFITFISFFFLYPATFNLLEVAAIKKPGFRIYETGITRITRHPQLWGQLMWCFSHALWTGTTLPIVATAGLMAHHFFGAWNGDRRLKDRYGKEWVDYANRTSIVPFAAMLRGDQELSVKEFVRPAYIGVTLFVLGTYAAHPYILRLVGDLHI